MPSPARSKGSCGAWKRRLPLLPPRWWFRSGKFDRDWALSGLKEVLNLVHRIEPDHLVAKSLAEMAPEHPLEAIKALRSMINLDTERWLVDVTRDELRSALSVALSSVLTQEPRLRRSAYCTNLGHVDIGTFVVS